MYGWDHVKESALKEFIHRNISHFQISRIILHGSYARGDYHENSDIDLIIVGDFKEKFFNRIGLILDYVPNNIEIEPLVYTESEFRKMVENENPFILKAISEGIDLLSD